MAGGRPPSAMSAFVEPRCRPLAAGMGANRPRSQGRKPSRAPQGCAKQKMAGTTTRTALRGKRQGASAVVHFAVRSRGFRAPVHSLTGARRIAGYFFDLIRANPGFMTLTGWNSRMPRWRWSTQEPPFACSPRLVSEKRRPLPYFLAGTRTEPKPRQSPVPDFTTGRSSSAYPRLGRGWSGSVISQTVIVSPPRARSPRKHVPSFSIPRSVENSGKGSRLLCFLLLERA
jgi:hypothetical protein